MAHKSKDLSLNLPAPVKPDAGLQVMVLFYFERRSVPRQLAGMQLSRKHPEIWSHYREKEGRTST